MDMGQCREGGGVGTAEGEPQLDGAVGKQGEERRCEDKPPVASRLSLLGRCRDLRPRSWGWAWGYRGCWLLLAGTEEASLAPAGQRGHKAWWRFTNQLIHSQFLAWPSLRANSLGVLAWDQMCMVSRPRVSGILEVGATGAQHLLLPSAAPAAKGDPTRPPRISRPPCWGPDPCSPQLLDSS